ncbi:MAG: hypothetical protein J6D07_01360, partial [Mogibacterium sp.]|nr:hypothetical protein [Mogibacterium sp.]
MNGKSNIRNWIKSAVINLIIMVAVMLLTHMVYETNDDYAIASRIVDGYPEIVFINYYLCAMLAKVQVLTSSLNIFVLTQILLSFISFTIVLELLFDKSSHRIIQLVSVSIVIMLSIDAY